MRIAYVCADAGVPVFGTKGCSIHVQEVVRALIRRGDSVTLYAAKTGGERPANLASCSVQVFKPDDQSALSQAKVGRIASDAPRVAQREASLRHLAISLAESILYDRYDLIYERYSLWSDATQVLARRYSVPSILEVNAPLVREQQAYRDLWDVERADATARNAFQCATSIVAVSEEVAAYVRSFSESIAEKVRVVPNGVDVNRFHPHVVPIDRTSEFTIGFVGSLKPWHGVESLLEAYEAFSVAYPHSRLKIIGEGPMREVLQRSILSRDRAAAGSIQLVGAIAPEEIPGHLRSLDVAVAPYDRCEGFYFSPLKVYEYMAAGLPVVASATGQLTDLIDDGSNGLLYEPGNVPQLVHARVRLVESAPLRDQLAHGARKTVAQHRSWQRTVESILDPVVEKPRSSLRSQVFA
jgi:glycosyltransferase involved in cell wall biosynthesis